MADLPIYWPKTGWVLGLKHTKTYTMKSEDGDEVTVKVPQAGQFKLKQLTKDGKFEFVDNDDLFDAGLVNAIGCKGFSKYWTTKLEPDSGAFKAIEDYIFESIANSPYRSRRWEGARMKNRGVGPKMVPDMLDKDKLPQMRDEQGVNITKIKVVYNPIQWSKYNDFAHRQQIWSKNDSLEDRVKFVAQKHAAGGFKIPVISRKRGEVYLFHGTSKSTANLIAMSSVDPTRCDLRGIGGYGSLGQGTYLSDNFAKIAIYTRCPRCSSNAACGCKGKSGHAQERVALLCRVAFSSHIQTTTKKPGKQLKSPLEEVKKTGVVIGVPKYDEAEEKVKSSKFPNNVFLATYPEQVYPEFIIYFQWARPGHKLV